MDKDCCYKVMAESTEWVCDPYCPRRLDDECPKGYREGIPVCMQLNIGRGDDEWAETIYKDNGFLVISRKRKG